MNSQKIEFPISDNGLQNFLRNKKATEAFTHTSIGKPSGSYYIPSSDTEEFMNHYVKTVFEDKYPTHLTEGIRDCDYTPLKIDIDFRYFKEDIVRLYTLDDIIKLCQLYMECLDEYVEDLEDNKRDFFILQKPNPTYDKDKNGVIREKEGLKRIKDGVHIMAPHIVTNNYLQLKCREHVFKKCGEILDKYNFDNTYADIFDRAVIDRNNWQMYGSSKPGQPAYAVSHVVRIWNNKYEILENNYTNYQLANLLSVRNKFNYTLIKPEKEEEVFSKMNTIAKKKVHVFTDKKKKGASKKLSEKELKLVQDYFECLDWNKRASEYRTWIEAGWCLHNLHNKDDTLLNSWIEFSKSDTRYAHTAEQECRELWEHMCDEGLGIGSLKLWAKKDSPEKYAKIVQNDIADHILKACKNGKGTSFDVARVIHVTYKDYFVCVSIKECMWYYYSEEENKWVRDDKGITLRRKISTEVYQEFSRLQLIKQAQSLEADDNFAQESTKIFKVMDRLKDTAFKNNVMVECAELFYDKDKKFLELLDSYNHLLGFKNGVYDLRTEEFRIGRPEDYVSMSTKINYVPYDPNDSDIQEIMKFYKSIFVIKRIRDYIFLRTASFLSGTTKDETFDIYSGGGGNGKSKHIELVEACLGDYAAKLPITLLTQKRGSSSGAAPELARTKGKRLCTLQEPDTNTTLNVGLMKELTGGDKIMVRALYSEPFEFKPQYKLVLLCNDKPKLPAHDEGAWRRIKNTEYISKFTLEPAADKVLQFKINQTLSEKFERWAEPFMSILIHYHKIYIRDNLKDPDEIRAYTEEYKSINNQFKEFINEMVDEDPNSNAVVSIDVIYDVYKKWYMDTQNDKKYKKRTELKTYLDNTYTSYIVGSARSKDRGYKGLVLRTNKKTMDQYSICEETDDLDI